MCYLICASSWQLVNITGVRKAKKRKRGNRLMEPFLSARYLSNSQAWAVKDFARQITSHMRRYPLYAICSMFVFLCALPDLCFSLLFSHFISTFTLPPARPLTALRRRRRRNKSKLILLFSQQRWKARPSRLWLCGCECLLILVQC